jgi:hypothetical protein
MTDHSCDAETRKGFTVGKKARHRWAAVWLSAGSDIKALDSNAARS